MADPIDPTARLAGNTQLVVEDRRLMDAGLLEKVRLICHLRKVPMLLYGVFLELTRQFYSDENGLPIDVCAHWDPDPTKTKIWIDTEYVWETSVVEFRPAIYIKLGPLQYSSLTGRHDGLMGLDMEQGEYEHSRNGTGTASWVHIGSNKGESINLLGSTLDYLDAFGKVIAKDFCFQTFEVVNVNSMQIEKESKERFVSNVTVSFSFQDTWAIKLESQKLKRVVINAGQGLIVRGIL